MRRIKLTMERLSTLKPPETGELLVGDTEVRNLVVRLRASGAKTFTINYRNGGRAGKARRMTLGSVDSVPLKDARARAKAVAAAVASGIDPVAETRRAEERDTAATKRGLGQLVEAYFRDQKARGMVMAEDNRRLLQRYLVAALGADRNPASIKPADITEVARKLKGKLGLKLTKRTHALLAWAVSEHHLELNVLAGRRLVLSRAERLAANDKTAARSLSADELSGLWLACEDKSVPAVFGAYVKTLILTGCRRSETAEMRLDWIVPDETLGMPVMVLPEHRTKSGAKLRIPMPSLLRKVLAVVPRLHGEQFVFPSARRGKPIRGWASRWEHMLAVAASYGVHGKITPHTLRRSARTGWAELNVPREICEAMLNHAPPRLVATYDKAERMRERAAAMTLWCDTVTAAVERARAARQWEAAVA